MFFSNFARMLLWFVYISETGYKLHTLCAEFRKKSKSMGWPLLKIAWQRRCSILFSMLMFMPVV